MNTHTSAGVKPTGLHFAFLQPFMQKRGTEVVFDRTCLLLEARGVEISYLCPSIDTTKWHAPSDTCHVQLLPNGEMWHEENLSFLEQYIKERGVDLIFYSANALHITRSIARRLGTRLVPWLHSMVFSELAHKRALQDLLPRYSLAWWRNAVLLYSGAYKARRIQVYLRDLRQGYRYIVLHSSYKEQLARMFRLSAETQRRILPIINTIPIAERPNLVKRKEIVYVGALCPYAKQVTRLVDIWSRIEDQLPDWEVKIYGTGEDEGRIRQLIAERGLQRIKLCGHTADSTAVYETAGVLCLTSLFEGWGLVLAEAQNYGVVPIAFDSCSGISAIIGPNNQAGVLVPHLDHETYARELLRLCQDESYRLRLQEACLAKRYDYAPDVNDAVWDELLRDVVADKAQG